MTRYTLRNLRISYEDLFYPFPHNDAKWKVKTLWEVQGTEIVSSIDAPLRAVSVDSSGLPISNTAEATRWLIYPTLGMAGEYSPTKRFHLEGRASGFAFPHRAVTWNAEATATYHIGPLVIVGGYQGFHIKTSPKREDYFNTTFGGPFAGLRWEWQ